MAALLVSPFNSSDREPSLSRFDSRSACFDERRLLLAPAFRKFFGPTLNLLVDSSVLDAAQPLHRDLGEGWNDCSSTQEPAGRGNEEMTQ
jgi:hypothetical protein